MVWLATFDSRIAVSLSMTMICSDRVWTYTFMVWSFQGWDIRRFMAIVRSVSERWGLYCSVGTVVSRNLASRFARLVSVWVLRVGMV